MKKRQHYWVIASFAFLFFVMLGYVVKFYPEALRPFDTSVQSTIRGDLPQPLTAFFKTITVIGNPSTQAIIAAVAVIVLWLKKWYAEAIYVATNSILAGICIVSLKYIYQRPRPSITHLVYASGNSFPSGHAMVSICVYGYLLYLALKIRNKYPCHLLSTLVLTDCQMDGGYPFRAFDFLYRLITDLSGRALSKRYLRWLFTRLCYP